MKIEIDDSDFATFLKEGLRIRLDTRIREGDVHLTAELIWSDRVIYEDSCWLNVDSLISDATRG